MMSRTVANLLFLIFQWFYIHDVQAGSFNVNPVQVHLSKDQKIENLMITNHDLTPLTIHLKVKKWHQKEGKNIYSDTSDLLLAPPIVTIDPQASQIIRIALKGQRHDHHENAYRLYITEIPTLQSHHTHKVGLQFSLKISMPVFIQPINDASLDPVFQASIHQGKLRLKNRGHRHGHVKNLHIPGVTKEPIQVGQYILPQQESLIPLPQINDVQDLRLVVDINNQKRTLDVSKESQNLPLEFDHSSRAVDPATSQ